MVWLHCGRPVTTDRRVQLDYSEAIPSRTGPITCALGLVRVSLDVPVGEAVSSVGNYVDFNVELQETETTATVNAFTVLLQGARDRICLPEKWNSSNAKLRLKNSNRLAYTEETRLGTCYGETTWCLICQHPC